MRQIQIAEFGAAEALQRKETPVPEVGPGQIRVQVAYAGVNYADIMQRRGHFPGVGTPPFTPGMEVVGTVHAIGAGAGGFRAGARVVAKLEVGGYADYAVADAAEVRAIPDEVSDEEALALAGTQGLTAYALASVSGEPDGRSIFVSAAAGGVGSLLGPLLLARGWSVIGGVSSEPKAEMVAARGAVALRYDQAGWEERLQKAAGPRGLALAFDASGGDIYRGAFAALGDHAELVFYGAASGELVGLPPELVFQCVARCQAVRGFGLTGFLDHDASALRRATTALFEARRTGTLSDLDLRVYPLEEAAAAHRAVEERRTTGKVLLKV
ncbi:MAG: zinc-binding dehydrogenase [Myxococcota bacterium]